MKEGSLIRSWSLTAVGCFLSRTSFDSHSKLYISSCYLNFTGEEAERSRNLPPTHSSTTRIQTRVFPIFTLVSQTNGTFRITGISAVRTRTSSWEFTDSSSSSPIAWSWAISCLYNSASRPEKRENENNNSSSNAYLKDLQRGLNEEVPTKPQHPAEP